MMRLSRFPFVAVTLAFLVACQSDTVTRSPGGPMFAVSDGAHQGNPDFFFLPPLFKMPNVHPGTFNPNLAPSVEVCDLGAHMDVPPARECLPNVDPVAEFAAGSVNVSTADELYHVNWHTDESRLSTGNDYRIRVLVGTTELGFADVDPVSTGQGLKNVQTDKYIGLVDGRTLPIKFRIENGALCAVDGTPCDAGAAATINLAQGGGVELIAAGEDFKLDIPPGTEATSGGQVVTDVTFNLEVCDGIDVDLPRFGACLRVTTFFDATGGPAELELSNPALISLCVLQPFPATEQQEKLITLHQQDGTLIRALPPAKPNCDVAAQAAPARGLAARGWSWVRDLAGTLITPRPLYASSRTALFDLGGGGETDRFGSSCDAPPPSAKQMFLVECPPSVAPQLVAAAEPVAGQTVSDFQFALPAMMDYINPDDASRTVPPGLLPTGVKVTDWDGMPVQGATVTFREPDVEGSGNLIGTATSNASGIAQISWSIVEGANTVVASGRGIAAQNNYPEATVRPFMPDPSLPPPTDPACTPEVRCQEAVALGTGAVTFSATGSTANLTISSFTRSQTSPTVADDITFTAVVRNDGSGPAPASRMSLRVGGETFPPSFAVPALAAGATFTVTRTLNLDVAQGYIAEARADINNDVVETSETDNNLLMTFVVTALTTSISDGAGDAAERPGVAVAPDLTSASAKVDRGNLTLQLRFAAGTFDQTKTMATIVIDIDQNPATGFAGVDGANNDQALIGAEYNLEVGSESVGSTATLFTFLTAGGFTMQKAGAITYVTDGADIVILLSSLGGDRGEMSFKVIVQTQISFPPDGVAFTGIVDYMTNLGLAPGSLVSHSLAVGS